MAKDNSQSSIPDSSNRPAVRRTAALVVLSLMVAGVWLYIGRDALFEDPRNTNVDYDYPVYATDDVEGNLYVIDTSRRRVTRRRPDGAIDMIIEGGSRSEEDFFYAEDITVSPDRDIYLLNIVTDINGYYLEREEILRYAPDGTFEEIVHQRVYGEEDRVPTLVQRGRISSLHSVGGRVGWVEVDGRGMVPHWFDPSTGEVSEGRLYELADADLHLADIAPYRRAITDGDRDSDNAMVYSTKDGRIVRVGADGSSDTVYTAPRGTGSDDRPEVVPWELSTDADGSIYFVDLENRALRRIAPSGDEDVSIVLDREVLAEAGHDVYEYDYYRLDVGASGSLLTTNDEAAIRLPAEGGELEYRSGGVRPAQWSVFAWLNWVAMLVAAIALIVAARAIYVHVLDRRLPPVVLQATAVITVVAIGALVVASVIIPNLNERHESLMLEKIGGMLQTVPRTVDGDLFHEIDGLEDYDSDAYREIREGFFEALNYNRDPWNDSYYFALYREIDGRLYGFMFLNGQIGMYHPYDWIGYDGVYDHALEGDVATVQETDISGDWMYGISPIRDSDGEIVALFETGTDLFAFNLANRLLIRQLILEVITTLVVLIILMLELTVLADMLRKRASLGPRGEYADMEHPPAGYSDVMLARPISFMLFAAISISLAYMPLLAGELYEPVAGLSREFLIALPLSAEMFAFGVASLLIGLVSRRVGWRQSISIGFLLSIGGLIASAGATNLNMLIGARALAGAGSGAVYFGLRALVNSEARREERSQGFSNLYSGMIAGASAGVVLGGAVADRIGYAQTFYVGLFFLAAGVLFFVFKMHTTPYIVPAGRKAENAGAWRELGQFLGSGRVWAFFLLLIIPTYVAGTYLGYFFPLFAESQGLTAGDIGRWWIVNGLMIVYLGPPLSRFFHRRTGPYSAAIFGSLLWGASLLFFAFTGSLWAAIVTLVVMGITEGFCVNAQNDVYLEIDVCQRIGEDKAVGYFELFSKIGETIGPIAFSLALQLGATLGMSVLGGAVILLALPFIAFLPGSREAERLEVVS